MNQILLFATDANTIQAWVSIAQLVLTLLTAVLIMSTFRLQAETFREQQEITKIEQRRFRREIKPQMTFEILRYPNIKDDAFTMTYIGNNAKNCRFELGYVAEGLVFRSGIFDPGREQFDMNKDWPFCVYFDSSRINQFQILFTVKVFYEDDIGTLYMMDVHCSKGNPVIKRGPFEVSK